MTSPRTDPLQKTVAIILAAAIGLLLLGSAFQKQHWDTDIFWALKSGELIVRDLSVPVSDPFSYTFYGKEWVDFTWGFQVIAYYFFSFLGEWKGLFILQTAITGLTFLFIFLNLKLHARGRAWLITLGLFLAYISSNSRLFIRPHLFEYFFVSLYLLLLSLHERRGRAWALYAIVPLQAVWVNIHSSAVLGIFIVFSYALGELVDDFRERGLKGLMVDLTARTKKLLIASAAVPLAALINPYGLKLVLFPFVHQSPDNMDALRHIGEWTKPKINELFFYIYPFPLDHFAFMALAAGVLLAIFLNRKALRSRDLMLLAGAFYMAASHVRWVPLFAYFAVPVFASNLALFLEKKQWSEVSFKWASFGLCAFFTVAAAYDLNSDAARRYRGLGLAGSIYPEGTVEFMKREGLKGNIFNEYVFGGYLIYYYPEMKVFIDGRTPTVYSPYFFWKSRLVNDEESWKRLAEEYGVNIALVKIKEKLCDNLYDGTDWAAVSFDDVSVLFLKKADFKDTVAGRGFKSLSPCANDERYKLPEDKETLLSMRDELRKVIGSSGVQSARAHRLLGLVDRDLGGGYLEEATREFAKAVELNPEPYTLYDYGLTLGKLKRHDEAIGAFERSIKLDRDFKEGYLAFGLAYYDRKDFEKAVCYLKQYIVKADDRAEQAGLNALGMSFFETGRFEQAYTYLKRAAFVTRDPKETGDIYYYIGNSLFEMREYEQGIEFYRKAVGAKPDYRKALEGLAASHRNAGRTEAANAVLESLK